LNFISCSFRGCLVSRMDLFSIFSLTFILSCVEAVKINSKSVEILPQFLRDENQSGNQFQFKDVSISFVYRNENVILDLSLNKHLIPDDHFLSFQKPNGEREKKIFRKTEGSLCHYNVRTGGSIKDRKKLISRFTHRANCEITQKVLRQSRHAMESREYFLTVTNHSLLITVFTVDTS
jgi:hypothetical protein